jgi:hypothetical protein
MTLLGMSSQLKTSSYDSEAGTGTTLSSECIGALPVFAHLTSDNSLFNDFTSVIAVEEPWVDSVEFILMDGQGNDIILLDDLALMGIHYPKGFLSAANGYTTEQEWYLGYQVDWKNVLIAYGPGNYQIKQVNSIIGFPDVEKVSCLYELCEYSDARADKTVRINLFQNGKIIGQGLDFMGVNWVQQYRFKGFFGEMKRRMEQDNYKDSSRITTQIQDTLVHEYTLQPTLMPICLRSTIDEIMLANDVVISDYNLKNTDYLKDISVYPVSVDTEYFEETNKASDEFKFEERKQNRVKRNVR